MDASERIARRMRLQDLLVLVAVVEAGSMGKAAQRLSITQPAISRSIRELEHAFGVRLLDRHRHGVEPTPYGRALLGCGLAVFDDLRQGIMAIEALADPTVGQVRVASGYHLSASLIATVVDRLSRRNPRITVHLTSRETTSMVYRELLERRVDLIVARNFLSPAEAEMLEFEHLFDDRYYVVAGTRHPLARKRSIASDELSSARWVLAPAESPPGAAAHVAFRSIGLSSPHVSATAVLPDVRMRLLATGRYLTIFSGSALRFPARAAELKVLPVELPLPFVPIGIVTLKHRTPSPATQSFINLARETARTLANSI